MGLFGRKNKEKMENGLKKTRTGFWGNIVNALTGAEITDDLYDDLEEQLILADVGADVALHLWSGCGKQSRPSICAPATRPWTPCGRSCGREMEPAGRWTCPAGRPSSWSSGSTGGQDHQHRQAGPLLPGAGPPGHAGRGRHLPGRRQRAAGHLGRRAGVPIVKAGEGADPAAVIFDTVKSAEARGYDMVIADTAGRLHNKANLMAELSKISRSVRKAAPDASLETLLVLDAITGQNAISQAREFCKAADASGVILTKLDGTAKGGCVVAVKQRLGLPVRFIGVGEAIDDLLPFDAAGFVEELLPRKWRS